MSTWLTNEDLKQRFTLLFEYSPAVVLALDRQGIVLDVNPSGLRITGYKREQVVGAALTDFIPPPGRAEEDAMFARALTGETVTFQCSAIAADGQIIEFQKTLTPVLEDGQVAVLYALLEDLTEQLRAQRTVDSQRVELTDLEHDFHALFARNPDGIALLGPDGTIIDVNDAALNIAGAGREVFIGQNFAAFVQSGDRERAFSFFRRALEGETVRYDIGAVAQGRDIALDVTLVPKHTQGVIAGVYCIMQDTTERKKAQRRNEMQAQRVRDLYLLATTPEYTDAHVMSTLQTGCRLLGMESGAIVTTGPEPAVDMRFDSLELFSGHDDVLLEFGRRVCEHRGEVLSQNLPAVTHGYPSWIGTRIGTGGTTHGVLLFFSSVQRGDRFEDVDHDTLALMSALVSASLERRRTRAHLRTLAYYDSLTGLPNRVYFQDRLRDALVDARGHTKSLAVLFFDLDRFKDINDSLGHAMGDRFLQMVAHRLVDAVGTSGLVARMGGDEFIVLLADPRDALNARLVARDLLEIVSRPYLLEGYEQFISASAGISVYPEDARDDEALVRNADMAMYHAKESGGSAIFAYSRDLEEPLRTRIDQEKNLRRAVERGEFRLHYQPIVHTQSKRILGVEALLRWEDGPRGLIYPDYFIPAAESSGLIIDIGRWVIGQAAEDVMRWRRGAAPDLTLSVNISARQFQQPDLCERLLAELDRHGFPPAALEIEITESMTLSNVTHAIETVRKLKLIGARISVDDFGTGHSSLNYLRRFEIDEIKIDRSFVAGIGHQLSDETIVKAILAMGQSLGLCIVAEGVETASQYEFLRKAGCERIQGYHFSRPLDAQAFGQLLSSRGTLLEPG